MNSSGLLTGKVAKEAKISILAFEVANTITRGANLMHSLSKDNVRFIKEDIIPSKSIQCLVSTDSKVLLDLAAFEKRKELEIFRKEVVRFGGLCKDPQWHKLDRFFTRLDFGNAGYKYQQREQAETTIQELMTLTQYTSELYIKLNVFDRFEQEYRQKADEMKSLNLPRKGEHLIMLDRELRQQKKILMGLKKKSLWSKRMDEVIEKLVDMVAFINQEIKQAFGTGGRLSIEEAYIGSERLGASGLALHYANIIKQIDNTASNPTSVPGNVRDALYHALPSTVKNALPYRIRELDSREELEASQIKAEMEGILEWLSPMAENTLKAHHGFGWVGEWATASIELDKKTQSNGGLISLQTLCHANKAKVESHILTLVTLLHQLISAVRRRDYRLKKFPVHLPGKNIPISQLAMEKRQLCNGSRVTEMDPDH